jgi:hypothetical protein
MECNLLNGPSYISSQIFNVQALMGFLENNNGLGM